MYKERDLFVCRIIKEHEWYCRILSKSNNHDFFSLKFMFFFSFFGCYSLLSGLVVRIAELTKSEFPNLYLFLMIFNRKQVSCLGKYLSISLVWSCFKWFFSGIGDSCGFDNFPSLGLTLFKST
jgi:hypothetical protein